MTADAVSFVVKIKRKNGNKATSNAVAIGEKCFHMRAGVVLDLELSGRRKSNRGFERQPALPRLAGKHGQIEAGKE